MGVLPSAAVLKCNKPNRWRISLSYDYAGGHGDCPGFVKKVMTFEPFIILSEGAKYGTQRRMIANRVTKTDTVNNIIFVPILSNSHTGTIDRSLTESCKNQWASIYKSCLKHSI